MSIICVENLSKTYTTYKRGSGFAESLKSFFVRQKVVVSAVDNISFTVKKGSICGLIGPNGAGKSTTIKMLCGTLYPTSGTIQSLGFSPYAQRKKYVSKIGAVFGQRSQLIWDIPPIDSFNMNRAIYEIPKDQYEKRLQYLSDLFELEEVMVKPTRVLSLGERMKCEFIMAMLHQPEIVFLDEPTIGLDIIAKTKIRHYIRQLNEEGTTFILTTHDLEDVGQLADQLIIINHGAIVFDDNLQKLKSHVGEKKVIRLHLEEPFDSSLQVFKPVRLLESQSPLEAIIEVDTSHTPISDYIEMLSRNIKFKDISITELPMEEIISRIYLDEKNV